MRKKGKIINYKSLLMEMLQTTNNKPFGIQTKITLLGIELILEQHSLFL